jgi:hypothetical protein
VDGGDEFVGFGCNDREGLEVGSVRPLPGVPDAGEGERSGFGESDGVDALDGLGWFRPTAAQAGTSCYR